MGAVEFHLSCRLTRTGQWEGVHCQAANEDATIIVVIGIYSSVPVFWEGGPRKGLIGEGSPLLRGTSVSIEDSGTLGQTRVPTERRVLQRNQRTSLSFWHDGPERQGCLRGSHDGHNLATAPV